MKALRREDPRLLRGGGRYVADIELASMRYVAFVRSPVAHADVNGVELPPDVVGWTGADLIGRIDTMAPNEADGGVYQDKLLETLGDERLFVRHEGRPLLAVDRVRHVGDPIAVVIAETPYAAADAAERVLLDLAPRTPVIDPFAALADDAPRLYDHWPDNRSLFIAAGFGDIDSAFAEAAHVSQRRLHSGRLACHPMEPRGVVAEHDHRTDLLTLWSSTQIPHPLRTALAKALGRPAHRIRVVAPDVGGGFGVKAIPYAEELVMAFLALEMGVALKWVEQRSEHGLAAIQSRDQIHDIELALDSDGRILGARDRFVVDNGAANPLGVVQPYNTLAHLCGCYRVPALDVEATAVVTNKAPLSPYRGAGRPEAVFAMDRIIDVAAREMGIDPVELRRRNLITADEMPYSVGLNYRDGTPMTYDSGDFSACFEEAMAMSGAADGLRGGAQDEAGRLVGVGVSTYVEGTGVGPFESARVRVDETGWVEVATGACSQGQGHETVFAELCAKTLGADPDRVTVIGGDTAAVEHGWGTLASRSAVVAGSAIHEAATALRDRIVNAVAEHWELAPADLRIRQGAVEVVGTPTRRMELAEVAAGFAPGGVFANGSNAGLDEVVCFEPSTVTFAAGVHVARVAVDPTTGAAEVLDYVVAHDCGPLLSPMIVDGQIAGGVAQGIGAALFEQVAYDADGQPQNPSLVDYLVPDAAGVPELAVTHLETPSPLNPLGLKGVGEAGAISPPAAVANAIEDALCELGIQVNRVPVSPDYLFEQLQGARS
ncbi:MAG: xanthine dehydrogenase family protein [Acidimicrobiia bacterium]|nr:xanthine dehydrogenase family protein [Acidimicrobiia bacterium]MYG59510.1 xanthine dehydrogenase family protein [Acidimicrobiia bacterium]MYH95454.1 xanthine dehydrogenase family protein [Acidimicrobiia bacterium]MYJ31594.1 xanthine dehydrogenase family protein [Acidimicrobiia bacterium]MYL07893.1 xanthine dehydrogenase family protein [Acidimicrobiia bacterium]